MKGNIIETLIGALVIVVAGSFLSYAYTNTEAGAVDGYQLSASFDKIDGIAVGSDVRVSGIKVGTVTGIELDPVRYWAQVNMDISDNYQFPVDTSARIGADGLLGSKFIVLEPGGDEMMLAQGGFIEYTQGSIDIVELVSKYLFATGSAE